MIDHATRFSTEVNIKVQEKEVVDEFIKHWVAIFVAADTILPDNWLEFNNDLFNVPGEQFNRLVKATSRESLW